MINAVLSWNQTLLAHDIQNINPAQLLDFERDATAYGFTNRLGMKIKTDKDEATVNFKFWEELEEGFLVYASVDEKTPLIANDEVATKFIFYFSEQEVMRFENEHWLSFEKGDTFPQEHCVLLVTTAEDEIHLHRGFAMPALLKALVV